MLVGQLCAVIRDWLRRPVSTDVDVVAFHEPSVALATMLIGFVLEKSPKDVLMNKSLLRVLGDCCTNSRAFMADWITPTRVLCRNVSLRACSLRVLNWILEIVVQYREDDALLNQALSVLS